jgi:hypothetical protein
MSNKKFIGVLPEERTLEEQALDWKAEEVVSAGETKPIFRTVKKNGWNKYSLRDQDGSGSCVSQALAKGFEVLYKKETGKTVVFSSTPIYQKRRNAPDAGMFIHDAFDIAVKVGTCPEEFCKSQKMTDKKMDSAKLPENFEDINNYLDAIAYVSMPKDFDFVALWVERYGYAQIHIASDRKSWSQDFPQLGSLNRGIRHAVAVVDAVTYNKVQYLVIEDSWGEFGDFKGQRLISREVFNDMFTSGAGFTILKYDVSDVQKFEQFVENLQFGQRSPEVARLQNYLKSRGFFPSNIDSTGYYGSVTSKAVLAWQLAMKVDSEESLKSLKGYYFGPKSQAVINKNL